MVPVVEWMRSHLELNPIYWDSVIVDEIEEKLDDLPENSLIVLENSAFHPEEYARHIDRDGNI